MLDSPITFRELSEVKKTHESYQKLERLKGDFWGNLLTREDKYFVARQQIFTEVSSPAYELQARNWRLCYETKLVELWREVGGGY